MYLRGELPAHLQGPSEQLVQYFDALIADMTLHDSLDLAGHLYECVWLVYIQEHAAKGIPTSTTVPYIHKMQEQLTSCLIHWARQKGKENGHNSTNLIQIPGRG